MKGPRAKAVTIKTEAESLAEPKGHKVDRFAPDAKDRIECTKEVADYIVREIAKGKSLIEICEPEGMPHMATFLRYCQVDADLADRYGFAKRVRAHTRVEQVEKLTNALDPLTTGKTEAYVTDIKAKNAVRLAEIGDPASFSPKMMHAHQHGGNIVTITMDLTSAQSRPVTDITASQVPETPALASPQSGAAEESDKGRGSPTIESPDGN